jgi:hypothetical protein
VAGGRAAYEMPIRRLTPDGGFAINHGEHPAVCLSGSRDEQLEVQEMQIVLQVCELYKPINISSLGVFRG